jgi:predicted 2-oxoglutarate/Fe(II)-dependent dioxygenase YbiX
MSQKSKDTTFFELIQVYKNVVPLTVRDSMIEKSSDYKWVNHQTHVRTTIANSLETSLYQIVRNYVDMYIDMHDPVRHPIRKITDLELNKYPTGTKMKYHTDCDDDGYPFLTAIVLLNDNFEGGDIVFWKDEVVKLEAGDLLLFPSMFAYPHRITEITEGTRYSALYWIS